MSEFVPRWKQQRGRVPALELPDDQVTVLTKMLRGLDGRVSYDREGRPFLTDRWGYNRDPLQRRYVDSPVLDILGDRVMAHRGGRGGRVILEPDASGWVMCADCNAPLAHLFEAHGAPPTAVR